VQLLKHVKVGMFLSLAVENGETSDVFLRASLATTGNREDQHIQHSINKKQGKLTNGI
jgi:hypothetical protein